MQGKRRNIFIRLFLISLKVFSILLILLILLLLFGLGGFLWSEHQRSQLIEKYAAPSWLINKIKESEKLNSSSLLLPTESKICAINSYSDAEQLNGLSISQLKSLPKDILPSEDSTWYLIFLSEKKAERIYLMDAIGESGFQLIGSGCVERGDEIIFGSPKNGNNSTNRLISFNKGEF